MFPALLAGVLSAAAAESGPPEAAAAAVGIGFWDGVLFGLIQGVTEFIPISSSGHLALGHMVSRWLGVNGPADNGAEKAFDVAVHAATLLVMLMYFRDELRDMLIRRPRLLVLIMLGSVPAGLAGLLAGDWFEGLGISAFILGGCFIVNGLFLTAARYFGIETKRFDDLRPSDSILIGLAQALALAPGISRSGMTITSGMVCGLRRAEAFAFSFLLGMPIIAAATALKLRGIYHLAVSDSWSGLVGGFIAAFFSGLIAVTILARLVKTRNLLPFGIYCLLLGLATVVAGMIWG
jgi:undecaprenyl-diphosphatase